MTTSSLEALLPEAMAAEAMAAEAVTSEAGSEVSALSEATAAEAVTSEAVAALGKAAPESAMTSELDFRETLGRGRLEVAANRCRRQRHCAAERDRLRRYRLQDSQGAQEEAQGQAHRAEHPADGYGDRHSEG